MGELVNEGTISMTARGTYNADGENVYLWKNTDNTYEFVLANGAEGLPDRYVGSYGVTHYGFVGNSGTNRRTGSGGQGGYITNGNNGSSGSYLGGSTRGVVRCNIGYLPANYTEALQFIGGNGKYHYILKEAKTAVLVYTKTSEEEPNKAYVRIENTNYSLYEMTKQVNITAKETKVIIKVKAEDGSEKEYNLKCIRKSEDASIKGVFVNGSEVEPNKDTPKYVVR